MQISLKSIGETLNFNWINKKSVKYGKNTVLSMETLSFC